jgi:hypothetical protein
MKAVPVLLLGGFLVSMAGFAALIYTAYYMPFSVTVQQGAGCVIVLGIGLAIVGSLLGLTQSRGMFSERSSLSTEQ